jgi:hypothetical protein
LNLIESSASAELFCFILNTLDGGLFQLHLLPKILLWAEVIKKPEKEKHLKVRSVNQDRRVIKKLQALHQEWRPRKRRKKAAMGNIELAREKFC